VVTKTKENLKIGGAKIKELVAQGKSLEEIQQAVGDQPAPAGPNGRPRFSSFTEVVYKELTAKTS